MSVFVAATAQMITAKPAKIPRPMVALNTSQMRRLAKQQPHLYAQPIALEALNNTLIVIDVMILVGLGFWNVVVKTYNS